MSVKLRIAIVVQGRFHAFDVARALVGRGHDVRVLTNYPAWTATQFGLSPERIRCISRHGIASRLVEATGWSRLARAWEPTAHRMFGRWAARELSRESWDVVHCWSGVSEEFLETSAGNRALTLLMRGSSHIVTQRRLLDQESARVGTDLDRPSDWMVARELREYARVDRVLVLSTFSAQSFVDEGFERERLEMVPLGVDVRSFEPPPEVVADRRSRIARGQPLTILYVGALSFRKGLWDMASVVRSVDPDRFRFLLVGKVLPEAHRCIDTLGRNVQIVGKVPQARLPEFYRRGDIFLFPTIEDGFPQVLAQARAARLPILTTPNGAGADIVRTAQDGWIVPIRAPQAIAERLAWCDRNRSALADMIASPHPRSESRDWVDVARDFERICLELPAQQRALTNHGY